jgi:DNA-binding MarR family transcriptional regulator
MEANYKVSNHIPIRVAPDFAERYPNASAISTECAMNLVFTADQLVKRVAELIQPFDLSPASGLVLSALADSEQPLSPNEIADRLVITRASVTGLVDSLEKRAYVERQPHPTDRRMILVVITEEGRQVADAFRPIVHEHQKVWFEALSEQEQQQFKEALHQVQAALMDAE